MIPARVPPDNSVFEVLWVTVGLAVGLVDGTDIAIVDELDDKMIDELVDEVDDGIGGGEMVVLLTMNNKNN